MYAQASILHFMDSVGARVKEHRAEGRHMHQFLIAVQCQTGPRVRCPGAGDFAGVTAPTDTTTRARHGAQPEVGSPAGDPGAEAVPFGRRRNLRASAGAADVVRTPLHF